MTNMKDEGIIPGPALCAALDAMGKADVEKAFLVIQAVPGIVRREHLDRRLPAVEFVDSVGTQGTLNGEPITEEEFLTLANAHQEDQGSVVRFAKAPPPSAEEKPTLQIIDDLDECYAPVVRLRDNVNRESLIVGRVIRFSNWSPLADEAFPGERHVAVVGDGGSKVFDEEDDAIAWLQEIAAEIQAKIEAGRA